MASSSIRFSRACAVFQATRFRYLPVGRSDWWSRGCNRKKELFDESLEVGAYVPSFFFFYYQPQQCSLLENTRTAHQKGTFFFYFIPLHLFACLLVCFFCRHFYFRDQHSWKTFYPQRPSAQAVVNRCRVRASAKRAMKFDGDTRMLMP